MRELYKKLICRYRIYRFRRDVRKYLKYVRINLRKGINSRGDYNGRQR